MKSAKKAIIAAVCAVMLVVGSVAGTMAYLTSQDSVTNTFTVGNVAITLDETDVDNSTADAARDKANSYKLMPGHSYTKDPIVHVASGSEECYLFVKVVNEIAAIEDQSNNGSTTVASQMENNGWQAVDGVSNVYVYATGNDAKTAVSASDDKTVFETFKIAGEGVIGGDKPTGYTGTDKYISDYANANITVTAYAVQKDGFESKTPAQIWSAAGFN